MCMAWGLMLEIMLWSRLLVYDGWKQNIPNICCDEETIAEIIENDEWKYEDEEEYEKYVDHTKLLPTAYREDYAVLYQAKKRSKRMTINYYDKFEIYIFVNLTNDCKPGRFNNYCWCFKFGFSMLISPNLSKTTHRVSA